MTPRMLHGITIHVKSLRHLPQRFFQEEREREQLLAKASTPTDSRSPGRGGYNRRCIRAQAKIGTETRETGNSVWGKGMKVREAMWLRGADTLSWRLTERQFKQVKAYTPVCKVYVYAADASTPSMDSSGAVGWFIIDMRDLGGQRQQERWVRLQGANPAEVLVSTSLSILREEDDSTKSPARTPENQPVRHGVEGETNAVYESKTADADGDAKEDATAEADTGSDEKTKEAREVKLSKSTPKQEARDNHEGTAVLATPAAEAVSELDALPIGPDAGGSDARVFSLSISVKGASRLAGLTRHIGGYNGEGFWFSYSIFGVVVQTDRFEHLAPQPSGDGPVLEPMLDSFRLRATLQGLCVFLGKAPPLQVYLCTEGRILAHAEVDMSLLLPKDEWESRSTSKFGRSGMEGDFVLRLPGEPITLGAMSRDDAAVTVCAELTRAGAIPTAGVQGDVNDALSDGVALQAANRGGGREGPGVDTWAQLAPKTRRISMKASLERLELGLASGGSDLESERLGGSVLVGILPLGYLESAPTIPSTSGTMSSPPTEGFCLIDCGSEGEVKTEDSSVLGDITWAWEGDLPDGHHEAPATVRVVGSDESCGVDIATGIIPWPSEACSGPHLVDVKLWSRDGKEVGSCRVCLDTNVGAGRAGGGADEPDARGTQEGSASTVTFREEECKLEGSRDGGQNGEDVESIVEDKASSPMDASATVSAKGVQVHAKEVPLEEERADESGESQVPRSYRLSINLASVRDLENAAHVVACYHYPHFGTSAPVRTSLVWAAPRMDTPLVNSCCTFSFGMSFDRLAVTVRDRKLVVSIRTKDRFQEHEVGLVTVPLESLVKSQPQYFRCRNTNKTFTSMGGFRAHLKARQRSGEVSAEEASRTSPIEVKVLDSYLTVASTIGPLASSSTSPSGTPGLPSRLCSLRVILMLEDMGPTGDPPDEGLFEDLRQRSLDERANANAKGTNGTNGTKVNTVSSSATIKKQVQQAVTEGFPSTLPASVRTAGLGNIGVMPPALEEMRGANLALEGVWREWERWRIAEEAAFAQRLREKDRALEDKWEARESSRRTDLAQARTDYAKLEAKLRKALSEVEARERALKAREESSKSDHAQKLSELQLLQRRLREETRHQVELERMKAKGLEKQLASQAKQLEDARARVASADEDFERFREKQRKTSEGSLRQELFRLGAAKAEAEAQVERERSMKNKALLEKEEYRAHIHKLARALKRHQERESTCARREMEQLRLEYLAREERFMLDGDRNELRTMKQELDELRHLSLVQEAQVGLVKANNGQNHGISTTERAPQAASDGHSVGDGVHVDAEAFLYPGPSPSSPPQPTPAPAQVSRGSGSKIFTGAGIVREMEPYRRPDANFREVDVAGVAMEAQGNDQVEGLVEWRDYLLGTGMYTEQNPIVTELNRWIGVGGGRGLPAGIGKRREE